MDVNLALGISRAGNRPGGFGNIPRTTLNPISVEQEFEPEVHWKETSESHIVVVNLPGFTREDVQVHIDKWGNLIINGERRVEEFVLVEGRMHKMERLRGQRFRKILGFPAQNLNMESVTAKFENETLYVWLPKVKTRPSADTEGSLAWPDDQETPEAKHGEYSGTISGETGSPNESELSERTMAQEDEGQTPESWRPSQDQDDLQPYAEHENPEEGNHNVLVKEADDFGIVEVKNDYTKEGEGRLPLRDEQFQNLGSCTSIFSKRRIKIASTVVVVSTVVVLSVGLYLSYKLSLSSTEDNKKLHKP